MIPNREFKLNELSKVKSSASEIDGSVENGDLKPLRFSSLNGATSYVNLDKNYVLANDGDYFEFVCKWDNLSSPPNTTLGLFGKNDGTNNNTIGVNGNPLQLYIRGETSTWMIFTIDSVFRAEMFNKFRLDVIGSNLRLTLNGVVISSVALASPITINNIGKAYGLNFVGATINYINIHTSTSDLTINNLVEDSRFTKLDITYSYFYKSGLLYMYNGLNSFVIYKKQSDNKYIGYLFKRKTDVSKNADNWRINIITLCDTDFTTVRYLTNGGEIETAFRPKEGTTLASDHMGGEFHGDEVLTRFIPLIDDVEISLIGKSSGICKKVEFIQISDLYCPTGLSYSGEKVVEVSKRWVFNITQPNKLFNNVKFIRDMVMEDAYMFMMPMKRTDSIGQISDTFAVSNKYVKVDVSQSGHSNPYYIGSTFGGNAKLWSNISNISTDVSIVKGWNTYPTAQYNTSPDVIFNKMYFNLLKNQSVSNGQTINAEFEFEIYHS